MRRHLSAMFRRVLVVRILSLWWVLWSWMEPFIVVVNVEKYAGVLLRKFEIFSLSISLKRKDVRMFWFIYVWSSFDPICFISLLSVVPILIKKSLNFSAISTGLVIVVPAHICLWWFDRRNLWRCCNLWLKVSQFVTDVENVAMCDNEICNLMSYIQSISINMLFLDLIYSIHVPGWLQKLLNLIAAPGSVSNEPSSVTWLATMYFENCQLEKSHWKINHMVTTEYIILA